jgi:hypothetical protein
VTVSQKVALSLLISVFLFAGFTVLAFTGLFDLVEARFYNPSIIKGLTEDINRDTETIQDFLTELQSRFSATLRENPVKRSFLPIQSAEDIYERTRIYGLLVESLGGLQWVRFIDAGGIRIHFSTYAQDILRQDRLSVAYRNYSDSAENLPYAQVEVPHQGNMKITLDDRGDRIIFSFPFYDSFEVYRGTALFSLSLRAITEHLIREGRTKVGENISILNNPPGIVEGIPGSLQRVLLPMIASIWGEGMLSLSPLDSTGSGITLTLISSKTLQGIFVGRLVDESVFSFPQPMKIILLASFFLTVYLIIFLVFNAKQDTMTVVENRLKQLRLAFLEQYYDRKKDTDLDQWNRELEQRREEIRAEIKQGLGLHRAAGQEIDALIDNFWDELLSLTGDRRDIKAGGIDEKKLRTILNRILQTASPARRVFPPDSEETEMPGAEPGALSMEELKLPEEWEGLEPANIEELGNFDGLDEDDLIGDLEEFGDAEDVEEIETAEPPKEPARTGEPAGTGETLNAEEINAAEAIIARSPPRKRSNIRLAFGDDDIPYIVESSGLELVDEDFDSELMGPPRHEGEAALAAADDTEEPEDLEELEELEEVEELDTAEEAEPPAEGTSVPGQDLDELAREIEFSSTPEPEDDVAGVDDDLEIVSPFADIFLDFSGMDMEDLSTEKEPAEREEGSSPENTGRKPQAKTNKQADDPGNGLEELGNPFGMSLVYRSFFQGNNQTPEFLTVQEDPLPGSAEIPAETVIEERGGLHFINQTLLYAPEETGLDREFKNLVDSVLK